MPDARENPSSFAAEKVVLQNLALYLYNNIEEPISSPLKILTNGKPNSKSKKVSQVQVSVPRPLS